MNAEALARYKELPLPDTTEEHWRFTDLRGFDPDVFLGTIERERITPDQAFRMLVRASQDLNVKLRDVAQTLVDTGETGATPRRRPPKRRR